MLKLRTIFSSAIIALLVSNMVAPSSVAGPPKIDVGSRNGTPSASASENGTDKSGSEDGDSRSTGSKSKAQSETPEQKRKRAVKQRTKMQVAHAEAVEKWTAKAAAREACNGRTTSIPGSSGRMYADGATTVCGSLPPRPAIPAYPDVPGMPDEYINSLPAIPARTYAYMAAVELGLPEPKIHIGPDPSILKENMAVVGHPYWLWTSDTKPMNASATSGPLTVTLRAEVTGVTFKTKDGESVSCPGGGTAYRGTVRPGTPSPDCGITFAKKGANRIIGTIQWRIHWTAAGQAGTFDMQRIGARDVRVGELQSVNTGDNPR